MTHALLGALLLAAPMQSGENATDTTFAAGEATELSIDALGGSITIVGVPGNDVRVRAEHSSRTYIDIDHHGSSIDIEAESRRGVATIVEYVVEVPEWMDLELDAIHAEIDIRGVRGRVYAETTSGDIHLEGGRGEIELASINGKIRVVGAEGSLELEGVAQGIEVEDSSGELYVESIGGPIRVDGGSFEVAELGSVGGRLTWGAGLDEDGSFYFSTHGGPIIIGVPEGLDAEFTIATVWGSVAASGIPGAPRSFPKGDRTTFTTGDGSASIELETFGGRISLLSRDEMERRRDALPRP